jgi:aspartyl-tRNA(Asn)/glutamyl-tRNA(Gln) amidotransferase subunit C
MSSPNLDVRDVARLARIELTDEEAGTFQAQLGSVLEYVEQLGKLDLTGVEPTAHASPIFNVWQADVAQPGLTVADALRNAPAQRDNMILVPKVVE